MIRAKSPSAALENTCSKVLCLRARLANLEQGLNDLISGFPSALELLQICKIHHLPNPRHTRILQPADYKHLDVFIPTPIVSSLSPREKIPSILAYAPSSQETASRLATFKDPPIPDTKTSRTLVALQ